MCFPSPGRRFLSRNRVPFSDDREGVELDSSMLMGLAFILGISGGAFALIAGHPLGLGLGIGVLWSGLVVLKRGLHG